ncbi:phage tail protein [Enterococcus casseliflavus]|uniref:phage tail protein n=1 Tax=Enterococcus casseliflavus TaxID=37734 RepID=UPI001E648BB0|nr:phage tail protein [Enterococcus casseliflavus]MCD5161604.1 phage tail protein [Enterococcus casseliflavus]
MTTENVRIAVRDAQDSQTLTFMDNSSPNAIHFDQADLTRFFEGDSTVLQMRFNKRHDRANVIREGSKLAFVYKGKDYWLNIITAKDVSHQRELMAFSLSLELNKEKIGFYAANTAMSFVEYLKSIDFEQTLTIGINEIADKKLKLDWDGDQSKLGRLYSLANKFDAEISFETILNDDYSLKQQIINIYKKHDESNQGIGQDKTATTLRVGKDLKVINRSASLENFYSAIRGTGKDGISINDIEFEELDANGNVLYFSKKGQDVIWAPQARDAFPSKNNPGNDGYLVEKKGETEYTTVEALKGYLLSELKKNSSVYVDYETEGHFDSDPGDTFSLEDSVYYNPPLYLEARVYEQTESLVLGVTSSDRTTFTNFVQKESEISNDLLARMRKLIEANKVFTYDIITSDGVTFKNGFGSTTLTARVRDGIKDVTDTFSLKWYKDGTLFSNTKTVTINAADIEEKAVFRFEVADDSGNVRGGAEVTVTNIDDGKKGEPGETYYPHRGYLMADGTFTKIYPNENLIVGSISPSSLVGTNSANQGMYPYRFSFGALKNIPAKLGDAVVIAYDWEVLGDDVAGTFLPQFGNTPYSIANRESFTVTNTNKKGTSSFITSVAASWLASTAVAVNLGFRADNLKGTLKITNFRFLISDVDSGWLPSPSEDYENAYPKYEGFYSDTNVEGSDNPDDYKPWKPFMGPQGKDGYTPVKNVDYFDGQPGQNGKSAYLWIRYSQNADGSGMTTDPANAKYTGYATTETNVAPTSPSVYKWQQTKGDSGIGIPGEPGPDGKTSYLHIKYSNDGGLTFTGNGGEDGGDYIGQYVDFTEADSKKPSDYTWSLTKGSKGDKGDPAPLISLSGTTQAITVDKDGKITPASSFAVTGTAVNTAISNWTYSLNGGNFASAVPTGVTRSGNTVTINPVTATFDTFTIKAADSTVSDVFTISRIKDGGEGPPGSDAYTVFLTNESYTFAGSTTAALAGSTTTEVIVYKGINKITPTSITVGTKPTGLSSSVSGSIITLTATTALVSKSGTVPITITADGKTFTKQFSYALSLQGATGNPGKGVTAEEISYAISQDGTTPPTSGWSGTRPTPKAGWYMWTRTRFKYTDNTYSAYFYLVAQQGKDAIVISDTAPANPTKGTLWQDSSVTPQIIKVFNGTVWSMWGMPIDNLLATNILSENGVFKRLEGAEIVNTFSYTDSGVTYTGTTTMRDGNVTIARTGSDGSTWTTTMDRVQGFVDTYKASSSAPARTTQLGQGKLYMVESGVGGYLPAAALNPAPWVNIPLASGFVTIEGATPQYRRIRLIDGSYEVQLRGRVGPSSGNFDLTGRRIGSIPYAASMLELFLCGANSGRSGRIQVELNGDLMVASADSGVTYISLSGIRFVSI